ncbi:MAG: sensor histidine kinase [Methyloligellaceae bacterium]
MKVRISSVFVGLLSLTLIASFTVFISLLLVSLRKNTLTELNEKFNAVLNLNERVLYDFHERNLLLTSALSDDYMILKAFVDLKHGFETSKVDRIRDIYQSAQKDRNSILMRDGVELYEFMHEAHHQQIRKYLGTSFFSDITLLSNDGQVFYSYQKEEEFSRNLYKQQNASPKIKAIVHATNILDESKNVSATIYKQSDLHWSFVVASAVYIKNKKAGYIVTTTPLQYLEKLLSKAGVLGETGAILLSHKNGSPLAWNGISQRGIEKLLSVQYTLLQKLRVTKTVQPIVFEGISYHTQAKEIHLGNKQYKLMIKQNDREVFSTLHGLQRKLVSVGILILFISLAAGSFLMRFLSQPLASVTNNLMKVSENDFSEVSKIKTGIYEVQEISTALESFHTAAMEKRKLEQDLVCRSHETEVLNEELKHANSELEQYRDHLEERIASRTEIIEEQAAQLEQALQAQKDLNDLQRSFVSMASHEFRTPLAVIDTITQKILRRVDNIKPERLTELGTKIRTAVKHMTGLMESTLAVARMENGKLQISPEPCDIRAIIQECCSNQSELTPSHNIKIETGDLPETLYADPSALEQVLTNLLSNAVKYSPDADDVLVEAMQENEEVVIQVTDYGLGIDEGELPKMFSRFFRASTSTGIAGTGIGLNLSKMLIEEHGGNISLSSTKGKGSTFKVSLPITQQEDPH